MFRWTMDIRRVATRYNRRPKAFLSAITLAATIAFWLCVLTLVESPSLRHRLGDGSSGVDHFS
ncbi:hypothetical protein FPS10_10890 [Pseudoruegeria sp. M32A2M]|nr:hypothetical protein [Pseudoruegeria sp. M32A2M]